ncbi:1-pyrroline-5-carboxylate dehydrogenase [Carpediemonas membranifera]|uniref:1-pyrroline-5-carboxylate dehydrogenase n=1 Tax=Carpediemonas membranifera TaxID=201153 RepID=A0A8J6B265_9EUKA|nr:1-pyrroline-5-carboxylate dehydrogenase [Carpediemonas membranifera]|eukprot:KAG9394128.1 1-pyrroline-5-carboxylate dehydrogenase [Carpediemonas membranifera]
MQFTDFDPDTVCGAKPYHMTNFVSGEWKRSEKCIDVVDPTNGEAFLKMPNTTMEEAEEFITNLNSCPKSGLHNMYKNPEKYNMWGEITSKLAVELDKPEVFRFFARCIQRVAPKDYDQAMKEVMVTRAFIRNFCADQVRFLARSFNVSGDYMGQVSTGTRWPYGPVMVIAPFNFPLEIPVLQIMGALYMGNKVLLKCASMTSLIMQEWIKLMHYCGAPKNAIEMIHCSGCTMGAIVEKAQPRMLQFTGSSGVAEELSRITNGKIKIEDAGFDWKILGPDADDVEYKAWCADNDAYAFGGQKCSAQSILFMHEAYDKTDFLARFEHYAGTRSFEELSIPPVLSHTSADIKAHQDKLVAMGGKVVFGGKAVDGTAVPAKYGLYQPTLVEVPLEQALKPENFPVVTTEIFGPFCVLIRYKEGEIDKVIEMTERMNAHLTAAVVSNDINFVQYVLGHTVNGTTYAGARARTTGAPQNHWFGPAGDPRGAGIGTVEAIRLVWSCHREIISDFNIPKGWSVPARAVDPAKK